MRYKQRGRKRGIEFDIGVERRVLEGASKVLVMVGGLSGGVLVSLVANTPIVTPSRVEASSYFLLDIHLVRTATYQSALQISHQQIGLSPSGSPFTTISYITAQVVALRPNLMARDVPRPKIPRTGKTKNVYLR